MRFSNRTLPRGLQLVRAGSLPPALALSALLMAVSLGQPGMGWLAWICLLPLLAAARSLRPLKALLAGTGWGICFYSASVGGAAPEIAPGLAPLALLTVVPAAYTFLGSLMTRAIGFIPAMMALLWILAETALAPLGLTGGLVAGAQLDGHFASWLAGLLGYVFVASAIVYANALILHLLSRVRLSLIPASRCEAITLVRRAAMPVSMAPTRRDRFTTSRPRAPPIH